MKHTPHAQSATSLPRAPRDDVESRSVRYLVMMGVRVLCFVLMMVVQPFGWYTLVFGAGAIFLPYIAVVLANVGADAKIEKAVSPEHTLPAHPEPSAEPAHPSVIQVPESHRARPAGPAPRS